jgi:hypothetical protein
MKEKSFLQKADEAYEAIMEFATMLGWLCVVGFLFYFLVSTIIIELFNL